jgi:3-methylfumaryl-CoA hydratase
VSKIEFRELQKWLGRSKVERDYLAPAPIVRLAATLNYGGEDLTMLPPLFHWLFFLPSARQAELGPDGHPSQRSFLPPVTLPRRMWAAGRLKFVQPIAVGETLTRTTSIVDVTYKTGKSGDLLFLTLRHVITNSRDEIVLDEFQDLVYRDHPRAGHEPISVKSRIDATARTKTSADETLLFRYSALTFNAHRIHYDLPYATQVEGYPALIVHGPLIATLLLQHLSAQVAPRRITAFEFKAVRPMFANSPFSLCSQSEQVGGNFNLWCENSSGDLCMSATASVEY